MNIMPDPKYLLLLMAMTVPVMSFFNSVQVISYRSTDVLM